jgi:hypothetical protein
VQVQEHEGAHAGGQGRQPHMQRPHARRGVDGQALRRHSNTNGSSVWEPSYQGALLLDVEAIPAAAAPGAGTASLPANVAASAAASAAPL